MLQYKLIITEPAEDDLAAIHDYTFFTIDERASAVNIERILYAKRDWLNIL